ASVRPLVSLVRDGDGAAGALRLEGGCAGFRCRRLHRRVARDREPALVERRGVRCFPWYGFGPYRHASLARHTRDVCAALGPRRRRRDDDGDEAAMKQSAAILVLILMSQAGTAFAQEAASMQDAASRTELIEHAEQAKADAL